jgi:hypothetical protein
MNKVVAFLNAPSFDATKQDLRSNTKWYVELSPAEKDFHIQQSLTGLNALDINRSRLIDLLTAIADVPGGRTSSTKKQAAKKRRLDALSQLAWAINKQRLLARFEVSASRGGAWHVEQEFLGQNTAPERAATSYYADLATVLVSGELELLRRCPCCKKFFVALKDPRERFCRGHLRRYYDETSEATRRKKHWRHERWKQEQFS